MPKTYEHYTCYPEHDHEIFRDAYDGKTDKVIAYINSGVNLYQKTKFSLATPLYLAISGKHTTIIHLLLDVYKRDLKFIETYFRLHHVTDNYFLKVPILIAYGTKEISLVEKLFEEHLMCYETVSKNSSCGIVILLKENNFTPIRVLHLVPQSEAEKLLALKLMQTVLHNGELYLNGCNYISDSMVKVATINGLFSEFEKLISLGCDYDVVDLSRLAMKSGQIEFLDQITNKFRVDINTIVENEIDLFSLIGSGEWMMLEWIVMKIIDLNGFGENVQLFWKTILDMCSDRYYGGTLYNYAIICEQLEFVTKYLGYGPNLKLRNRDGSIPIHHAFHNNRYKQLVSDMIEADSELLKLTAGNKKNVLHLMVEHNWHDVFENVLRKYSDSRIIFFNNMEIANAAITYAIFQKFTEIVLYIIGMFKGEITYDDFYSFLHTAVAANAKEIIEYILKQVKFDLCRPNQNGAYPLMMALWNRNLDIYFMLIDHDRTVQRSLQEIKDVENNSLLRYTIWSRNYFDDVLVYEKFNQVFNELLLAGLEYNNIGTYSGQNLIHHCALMGNDTIIQSLMSLNMDTELWDAEGNLAIHYAPNLATFKILNEKTSGRQINKKNKITGNTPLHMLMMKSFETELPTDLLEYMIRNSANVNASNNLNRTPLHLVQNEEWCKILLENGGDINLIDNEGNTPVHTAFLRSNYKVAMILFEQDINLDATNNSNLNYLAALMQQPSSIQLYPNVMRADNKKLIDLVAAHCNSYNELGTPALIESMHNNDFLCQMILNNQNCDVNLRDKLSHRTAIHATAIYNKFEIIDRLIEMGANINDRDSDGNTPLHHSCQFFHEHAIDFLRHGADVNAENNNKETALHYVALADLHGHTVCQMLLHGANLKAKNNDGNMPYDLLRDDLKQIFKNFLQ